MEDFIQHDGYLAVLILAGFAADWGYLDLSWVMVVALIGSVRGDQLFYSLGHRHSETLLRHRPAWQPRISRAQELIQRRHGPSSSGSGSFTICALPSPSPWGSPACRPGSSSPLTLLKALTWSIIVSAAGYLFGQALQGLFGHLKKVELLTMLDVAIVGGIFWVILLLWVLRETFNH
jgi:membrane protein DedA with SNARE-associated domain